MKKDFIGLFERFAYKNTYIYNLVGYFSRYIDLYLTFKACISDIIILFDYYSQKNLNLYTVYMDTDSHFISQKFYI